MGGREGGRGYLYQSIATLLSSLNNDDWDFVQVEADTENDKVDILWEYKNNESMAVQVKSSQNNISKSQILSWLSELANDASEATTIQLLLIGNVSDETSRFISKINKLDQQKKEDMDYQELSSIETSSKLEVVIQNFQMDSLEASMNWAMNNFLFKLGHPVSLKVVEQITGALVYQFTKFSTQGKKISRKLYVEQIEEWVYFNYPEVNNNNFKKKILKVNFFEKHQTDIAEEMVAYKIPFTSLLRKQHLQKNIETINKIKLPPFEKVSKEERITNFSALLNNYQLPTRKSYEMSDESKNEVRKKVGKLLEIDLPLDFFNVGNLEVVITPSFLTNSSSKLLEGSLLEKQKGELVDSLISDLNRLESLVDYFSYLENFFIMPLILENIGSHSDEDIEVNLKFPREIYVLTKQTIRHPNLEIIDSFIGQSNNILAEVLQHSKSYNLEEHYSGSDVFLLPSQLNLPLYSRSYESEIEIKKKDFESTMGWFFGNELFVEKDFVVLQYRFASLNAGKKMAFPSHILVKAKKSFKVEYEITSRKLNAPIKGELLYNIN